MENDYQEPTYETSIGDIRIDDDVIAVCTVNATINTEGVSSLSGGISNQISKTLFRKDLISKGVKINRTDEGLILDVFIVVDYGVRIQDVAFNLQRNISEKIKDMTDINVIAANIHVQGVSLPDEAQK